MIRVYYDRKIAGIKDIRFFKDIKELNQWLSRMYELDEKYYIIKIEVDP